MSPANTTRRLALPRTRSIRRRSRGRWWLAAVIAGVVNLALVVGLARLTHPAPTVTDAPLAVLAFTPRPPPEPEPEPEPPPDTPAPGAVALPTPAPALALPALELPSALPSPEALRLPDLPPGPPPAHLPVRMPALAAVDPGGIAAALPPAPPSTGAGDTEARLESAMDLDRHYPRAARQRGITGTSTLRVSIDPQGRVAAVEVLASEPPGMFDGAARRLAESLRYSPARRSGAPTSTVQTLTISWTLR